MRLPSFACRLMIAGLLVPTMNPASGDALIYPAPADSPTEGKAALVDVSFIDDSGLRLPLIGSKPEMAAGPEGAPAIVVKEQQVGVTVDKELAVTSATTLEWSWEKPAGSVCIVQVGVMNPESGQHRYLGYGAGSLAEEPSPDPTVEVWVSADPPREWAHVKRRLLDDVRKLFGWQAARVESLYFSPWDGQPGLYADVTLAGVKRGSASQQGSDRLEALSKSGLGEYQPQQLPPYNGTHVDTFETSFEEAAPTRNSAANEWSAFGAIGDKDFNCMGRDMDVRYPAFDLVFRVYDGQTEVQPGDLSSFRLGLVDNRLPAVWGGWRYNGLLYKVSAMTATGGSNGHFDLYRLDIQNPTDEPIRSQLVAGLDGPPDMRLESGIVRGLGSSPFVLSDGAERSELVLRDWGLCDKRAKAYAMGGGPGKTEDAISRTRVGLDGLPVLYRVRAQQGKRYVVYLAASQHIGGYLLDVPQKPGDLVYEYRVEGCDPKTIDVVRYIQNESQPLCAGFDGAHDADGDGYLTVAAGVDSESRIRHTRLSAIYVFPEGTSVESPARVYSGEMNSECVLHVDVGATPEQSWQNQLYDKSDVGIARLKLCYDAQVLPHEVKTYWIKVPPIHRREPVSMGYVAHAFRDVLPGEAVPPFPDAKLKALQAAEPQAVEDEVRSYWGAFFSKAASVETPYPILTDVFLSRLATRAIMTTRVGPGVYYNPCSPFFYFDHAYRDQAYVVYAFDLAGLHQEAEKLLDAYCMDVKDVTSKGPVSFDGKPLQLGMLSDGLWLTRPGQYDTQGQNIWALSEHYKLSGDRGWLADRAYPYIRRGAMWIVDSRRRHMDELKDTEDARHGLIEPGAMEVLEVGKGMHMYYQNAFSILGLQEAADCAQSLGKTDDARLFSGQCDDLKQALRRSMAKTFQRTGLYEGHLAFGVEPEGVGMYGYWAHNCLLWPCRALDPEDPLLTATWRRMESMSNRWGGGMHSEGAGSYWPYIGVDRAVSYILRGEPDRALDYFCAYTDTAGGTMSWGEGYGGLIAGGDQPHFWADGQWVNLFRQLFAFEDRDTLMITPATFRRWQDAAKGVTVKGLPTHFGTLSLRIADADGRSVRYILQIDPKGDQDRRELKKAVLFPRIPGGRGIAHVTVDGQPSEAFTRDAVVLPKPARGRQITVDVESR